MADPVATYSICACDLAAGHWGVATQSKFLAVGSVVPWAAPHVGAIATQSYANPRYGPDGLAPARGGAVGRGGRGAPDRRGRRAGAPAARSRRRPGARGDVHRRGLPCLGGRPHGRRLRGAGQHPRLGRDRRRARGDLRGDGGRAARGAAARLPRRRRGRGRRQPRPAVGGAPRRRARRRLRGALGHAGRPPRRRPRRPAGRAPTAPPAARRAVRPHAARPLADRRRRAADGAATSGSPGRATTPSRRGQESRTSRSG